MRVWVAVIASVVLTGAPQARAEDEAPAAEETSGETASESAAAEESGGEEDDASADSEGVEILDSNLGDGSGAGQAPVAPEAAPPAARPGARPGVRMVRERQIEGTTAKRQFDQGNIVIKSPYRLHGRELEVDPD
ncbi:MAG: hypothetical protein IT285_10420 [Bdellovibrionales bacterium]|nr:hypothetical protein [Bdellovibrionales bacterium]